MNTIYKPILGLITIVILTGCSALKNNVTVTEPQEGKRARIRVVIPDSFNFYRGVRAYPNSTCTGLSVQGNGIVVNPTGFSGGFEKSLNGKTLGMPENAYTKNNALVKAEFYASADKPISLTYTRPSERVTNGYSTLYYKVQYTTEFNNGCTLHVSFTPNDGEDYQIVFDENDKCDYSANQLNSKTAPPTLIPVKLITVKHCEE